MNKVIILRKIHVKMKSFAPPFSTIERNKTYSRLSCRCITYSIRMGYLDWCKWQKQPLEIFCEKSVLKNFSKFTGKHLCQQSLFLIKLQTSPFFTEQLRTTASEMRALQKRSERYRLPLL